MQTEIMLYRDATISLALEELVDGLNVTMKSCRVSLGRELIEIPGPVVSLTSYDHLPKAFLEETATADLVLVATGKRYDNNFFYEYAGKIAIVSFAGWGLLTTLPPSNGLVLMLAEALAGMINLGASHERSRGCVNDFRQQKTDIDFGLRAAFVCDKCLTDFSRTKPDRKSQNILDDVRLILDDVSSASRSNSDIASYWCLRASSDAAGSGLYDVFLCHNSQDKPEVRDLNARLKREHVRTWFDEDELTPGMPWQPELERQIRSVKSAAVVVGSSGRGPWQDFEIRAFLGDFAVRGCRIIPVLLQACLRPPDLPLFLSQFTWVDFRQQTPDPWQRLLWGIRGTKA